MADASAQPTLDIKTQQIASVYAKAFVGAAESTSKADELVAELDSLVTEVLDKHPALERILGSALIDQDEKNGVIDRVFGKQGSPLLLSFLKVLSKHGRLDCLRAVRGIALQLLATLRNRVEVIVRSAAPLDAALTETIVGKMHTLLGKEPELKVEVDPSLLGGLVVRMGDTVFDGSVATQLSQLRNRMIERTVEEIETGRERFLQDNAAASA